MKSDEAHPALIFDLTTGHVEHVPKPKKEGKLASKAPTYVFYLKLKVH